MAPAQSERSAVQKVRVVKAVSPIAQVKNVDPMDAEANVATVQRDGLVTFKMYALKMDANPTAQAKNVDPTDAEASVETADRGNHAASEPAKQDARRTALESNADPMDVVASAGPDVPAARCATIAVCASTQAQETTATTQ